MARVIPWLVTACLLPAALQAQPATPARDGAATPQSGTSAIRGRILDAATGRPLSRAEVRVLPNPTQIESRIALTGADGRYAIGGLPAGTYTVSATKPNFVRTSWGEPRPEGPGKRIPVGDGETIPNIDLRLKRTGVVMGKVVDEFGDPVTDVFVTPMRYQFVQGSRRLVQSGRGSQTNDIGEFRVYGLTPGQYYISATLRNFNPVTVSASDAPDRSAYAPTFYPGTGNLADAQRLAIEPGQSIAGITLMLLPIQAARVSGSAIDGEGKPMGGMINVVQRVGAAMIGNMAVPIRPDGKFTVALTPGDYTLRAFGQFGGNTTASIDLTVNGSDIDDVRIVSTNPATIRGRMAFTESATGAPPPKMSAIDLGAVREWAIGSPFRSQAKVKDDGTFEISLPAGHVLLRGLVNGQTPPPSPGAPAQNWRLSRVLQNGVDVADTGIDVASDTTIDNVIVEWTNQTFEASGKVTDADGNAVRDCYVIVFAQDPAHWTVQTRHLSVSRPALDDRFHVRLLPGDYYAVAMNDVETNAWTDPEFLAHARDRATRFSIAPGESKTIDLPLTPAPVF
jgi:Carboxypeptidase regulatory-like domain